MEEIDIMQLLKMFWRKKIIIILITIIGLVAGYVYNMYFTTPKYKATASFFLVSASEDGITTTDVTLNSKIINNYAELIKNDLVLDEVVKRLEYGIDKATLKKSITVNVKTEAEVVELSVSLPEKENTPIIANKILEVLKEKVKELYNMDNIMTVPATTPFVPYNIQPVKIAAVGAVIGFVLACAIILILNMFDDTVKEEADVESKTNLKVLAKFRKSNTPNTFDWNPKLDYVESFKALRTNLQFSGDIDGTQTIAISSTFPGEGKSWVVTYLAMAYAKADYKVLIIDADLRKGVQHLKFKVDQKPGLNELIKYGEVNDDNNYWGKYIKKTKIDNIFLLPSGKNTFDSSELLLSNKLKKIIEQLKKGFDIIIFDSTPSCLVADAVVLSRLVDTNIIVTEFEKTKFKDLKTMKESIENVGGEISGVVINKVTTGKNNSYYYYGNQVNMNGNKKAKRTSGAVKHKSSKRH